jgi:hypothetical protein
MNTDQSYKDIIQPEEPKSVTIGVDLIEHKLDLTGQKYATDQFPPTLTIKDPCPECGATHGFQVAMREDTRDLWVFCMRCGSPLISLYKLAEIQTVE